jgi:hypothetical protein
LPSTYGDRDESHGSSLFGFGRGVHGLASEQSLLGSSNGRPQWTIRLRQHPYGYFCLTYPTYPTPTPPSVFLGDYGCPSKNIYHANLRTSRLFIPGAPGAYDAYYYDWTDPLDHVTAPFVVLTWPIKALSTPVVEVEAAPFAVASPAPAPLATGRSVVTGHMGSLCSTPVKNCELSHASYVGNGCSCRVPGGRARGSVSP